MLERNLNRRDQISRVPVVRLTSLVMMLVAMAVSPAAGQVDYWVKTSAPTGYESLEWAINEANISGGTDNIFFDITDPPGAFGLHVISPVAGALLPPILESVVIDGYKQPGATPNTNPWTTGDSDLGTNAELKVVLDGSLAGGGAIGLDVRANDCIIRGLGVVKFDGSGSIGIKLGGEPGGNKVEGNFIGVMPDGLDTPAGNHTGVLVASSGNLIGGQFDDARNLISTGGLQMAYASGVKVVSYGNEIQGNLFGTTADGLSPLVPFPTGAAIWVDHTFDNLVGGSLVELRNVIGNHTYGVLIIGRGPNHLHRNYIGTHLNGELAGTGVPNNQGVRIVESVDNQIGGPDLGNTISHNYKGVVVICDSNASLAYGNTISQNRISRNDDLGIDLQDDGVTPNDTYDPVLGHDYDLGGNDRQNFPRIQRASYSSFLGVTFISGHLRTNGPGPYLIEFFTNRMRDPVYMFGEGANYVGNHSVTTNSNGIATFTALIPGLTVGHVVTATATDLEQGSTSEFSRIRRIANGFIINTPPDIDFELFDFNRSRLRIPLSNESDSDAHNVRATLQSEDSRLTVLEGEAYYGLVPAFETVFSTDDFLLEISDQSGPGEYLATLIVILLVDGEEYEEIMPVMLSPGGVAGIEDQAPGKRPGLAVRAFPNPANPMTTIAFELPAAARVSLRMYDTAGRLVRDLVDADLSAGPQSFQWDGRDRQGRQAATGTYYFRLTTGREESVGKVVLLK